MLQIRDFQSKGVSLVETLVVLSLLGIIMIPILFTSSAYFTGQLSRTRASLAVAHNASQFINRFMTEAYYATRVLPGSTTSEIHLAYDDPVSQTEKKVGYRLTASGSNKVLTRLQYNTSSGLWNLSRSPYASISENEILLPSTAAFKYCADALTPNCTVAAAPEQALLVRLEDWEFLKSDGSQRLTLPPSLDLDLYLGAGITGASPVLLSDKPSVLYTIDGPSSYNSDSSIALTHISRSGQMLRNAYAPSGGGGLSIILSTGVYPGYQNTVVGLDGRVFFAEQTSAGKVYTWKENTGLSLIHTTASGDLPGFQHGIAVTDDSRVFWGDEHRIHTWKVDTGLSMLYHTPSNSGLGKEGVYVNSSGRMYAGQASSDYDSDFITWDVTTGLTVIVTDGNRVGSNGSAVVSPLDGSVYFGERCRTAPGCTTAATDYETIRYWKAPNIFSTISATVNSPGDNKAIAVASDGRLYFAEDYNGPGNGNIWTWVPGGGAPTALLGSTVGKPGERATAIGPDDRVYFGGNSTMKVFTYKPGVGLSTIGASTFGAPGYYSMHVGPDGRLYFGTNSGSGSFYTWKDNGTGAGMLSMLVTGAGSVGYQNAVATSPDGRVFFGQENASGSVRTWTESSGLSVLVGPLANPGTLSMVTTLDGRVFFGQNSATPGALWTWKEGVGLSTIVTGATNPGYDSLAVAVDGRIFFGEYKNSSAKFYTWKDGGGSGTVFMSSPNGAPVKNNITLSLSGSPNYSASAVDEDNSLFLLDTTAKTLDYYTLSSSTYSKVSGFTWSTWATTVGAFALGFGTDVALLDSGNKQIDVYANRTANGIPAAPTSYSISSYASLSSNPTGLARSKRTGNYLVLDSTLRAGNTVNLVIYNSSGVYQRYIPIVVDATNLPSTAVAETNFKILLNDQNNVLYLLVPSHNKGYALSMPEYL